MMKERKEGNERKKKKERRERMRESQRDTERETQILSVATTAAASSQERVSSFSLTPLSTPSSPPPS